MPKVSRSARNGAQQHRKSPYEARKSKKDKISNTAPIYRPLHEHKIPHHLLISLDIGTSFIKVATGVRKIANQNPLDGVVDLLPLQFGEPIIPATMAILPKSRGSFEEAEFIFGNEVTKHLEHQNIMPSHVWLSLKQCSILMNPLDPVFADKKRSLQETQERHEQTLTHAKRFDKIVVRFPRSGVETYYPKATDGSGRKTFRTIRDIFILYLRWILDLVRHTILNLSNFPEQIFQDFLASRKIRVGVAVPDVLSPSIVSIYQQMLMESGYGQHVEMLSEARCAAISVAKEFLAADENIATLGKYGRIDLDVCDSGHGITDMSTIRATKNGALLQFKFVVESTGNSTGGKVVSDVMMHLLRQHLKPFLSTFIPGISDGVSFDENAFFDSFYVGIEQAKPCYTSDRAKIGVAYNGTTELMVGTLGNGIEIGRRTNHKGKHGRRFNYGSLENHYNNIKYHHEEERRRELFCIGGGFAHEYVKNCVVPAAARFSALENTTPQFFGSKSNKHVAQGGVLMLNDEELCKRRFHSESLGCVLSETAPQGKKYVEKPVRVHWIFKIGQCITERADFTHRYLFKNNESYEIEQEKEHDWEPEVTYPVQFKWMAARTADRRLSDSKSVNSLNSKIHLFPGIVYDMDEAMCKHIGWTKEGSVWKLRFEFELRVLLEGNVVRCMIKIPRNGVFQARQKSTDFVRFEGRMGASVSNLCHKDLFKTNQDDDDEDDDIASTAGNSDEEMDDVRDATDGEEDDNYHPRARVRAKRRA